MDNLTKLANAELEIQAILKDLLSSTGKEVTLTVEWSDVVSQFEPRSPRVSLE